MKFFKFAPCALAAIAFTFASCGNDNKNEEPQTPDEGGQGSMEVMTPEESKDFLSQTAIDFIDKFNPSDQREVIKFAADFTKMYGDLELPENFCIDEEETYSPNAFVNALKRGVESYSPSMISRAAYEYTYNIDFAQFAGEYVPGRSAWIKQKDSNDVILFAFSDSKGNDCELRIKASDGTSDVSVSYTYEEEGDYWDDEDYVETTNINLSIPRTINFTLKQGANVLASGYVKSKIDIKGHQISADVKVSVANLEATAVLNGTDSKIAETAKLNVSGQNVLTETAEINGNNLCNVDAIKKSLEKEDASSDELLKFFTGGVVNVDVLGAVQIYGSTKFNRDVLKAFEDSYCEWGYDYSESQARQIVNSAVSALNKNVDVVVKYNKTSTTQASVLFASARDNWGGSSYGEYYVESLIQFPDKTTYSFDEYFENGFHSVTDAWDYLIHNYERMWKNSLK